jgi:hypothetical protein
MRRVRDAIPLYASAGRALSFQERLSTAGLRVGQRIGGLIVVAPFKKGAHGWYERVGRVGNRGLQPYARALSSQHRAIQHGTISFTSAIGGGDVRSAEWFIWSIRHK